MRRWPRPLFRHSIFFLVLIDLSVFNLNFKNSFAETNDPTSASVPATSSSAPGEGVSVKAAPPPAQAAQGTTQSTGTTGSSSAAPSAPSSASSSAPASGEAAPAVDPLLSIRDPFKTPESLRPIIVEKTELERYGLSEYKFTGLLTGPVKFRAMILAPNGKIYFINKNQKLGSAGGVVVDITADYIRVKEKTINMLGQTESVFKEIKMPKLSDVYAGKTQKAQRDGAQGAPNGQSPGPPAGIGPPAGMGPPGSGGPMGGISDPNVPAPGQVRMDSSSQSSMQGMPSLSPAQIQNAMGQISQEMNAANMGNPGVSGN